jgi:hypothetical protein
VLAPTRRARTGRSEFGHGLGHGEAAAAAADAFCAYVRSQPDASPDHVLLGAHAALRGTRGVVAAVLRIHPDPARLELAGVGNIEVHSVSRTPIRPTSHPGVVGVRLRTVRTVAFALHPGDLVILRSDGISSRFDLADLAHLDAQPLAEALLARHGTAHDDASCLVLRYA